MKYRPDRRSLLWGLALSLVGWLGGASPSQADMSVKGLVTQVAPSARTLDVDTGTGTVKITVGSFTWMTKDNLDCTLTNLRVGDKIRASVYGENGGYSALKVDAQTTGRRKTIKGVIVEVSAPTSFIKVDQRGRGGEGVTPVAYDGSTIFLYGGTVGMKEMKPGDGVTISSTLQPNGVPLATRVDVSANPVKLAVLAFGVFKSLEGKTIVLQSWKDGTDLYLATDTVRRMIRNKKPVILSDLARGDRIYAVGVGNFAGGVDAQMINALSPDVRFTGTIEKVDPSNKTITLKPFESQSPAVSLLAFPASIVLLNGKDVDLNSVRVGDMATVTSIIHPDGPWGIACLEIVRLVNGAPPGPPGSDGAGE